MKSARPSPTPSSGAAHDGGLVSLTYELLDAHADTARLVGEHASGAEWHHHLAYLRDLQRVGREALARTGTES